MPGAQDPAAGVPASLAAGRYELRRFLGQGARKRVFLAFDTRLGREVAVSLIGTAGLDSSARERLNYEAQAVARLGDHAHVVTVHDIGEADGWLYIVTPYMPGGSVDDLLRRGADGRLTVELATRIAAELCDALEYCHARGVVHRDVKPGNVWISQDGAAKLGDFGLASTAGQGGAEVGQMVGTPAYMPPEQAFGRAADPRSDLYSLGATLYEMLAGRPPFVGQDAVSIISQHIHTPPVAPSWHVSGLPAALEQLVLALLAKSPDERPATAAAVRQALAAATAPTAAAAAEPSQPANELDALSAGAFAGRVAELERLKHGLDLARGGQGRFVTVAGEPGIGKTRLVEQAAVYARLRGMQVLTGRCHEGDGAPAFWPWVQIIRAYAHNRDPEVLRSELGSGAAHVAHAVSVVRERLPDLPHPAPLDPEEERFRLFDSVTTFLRNAAQSQPLMLVLDDLHWCDRLSLLLLQFLVQSLGEGCVCVVATYRDIETDANRPLAALLGALGREGNHERVVLRGLSEEEMRSMINAIGGRDMPGELVQAIARETEGNPFFIEEIVRHLVQEGVLYREGSRWRSRVPIAEAGIPAGVRDVITRRLERLSEPCRELLTRAAVIGREFDTATLEAVGGTPEEVPDLLDEALAARVIGEVPQALDRFRFAHALVRETLYESLRAAQRIQLHRRIGDAVARVCGADIDHRVSELAYHFYAAAPGGDVERAIEYARRAAARAGSLLAYEEAVTQSQRALELLSLLGAPNPALRCELLIELGEAQSRSGEVPAARERYLEAIGLAREPAVLAAAPHLLARAALGYGGVGLWVGMTVGVTDEFLLGVLEQVLREAPQLDPALRARLLARLSMELYWTDREAERDRFSAEAVEIARRAGDLRTIAYALNSRRWGIWRPDTLEERLAIGLEMLRLAEQARDCELELQARNWLMFSYQESGDIDALEREMKIYEGLAAKLRQPYYQWWIPLRQALLAQIGGRFEEAERFAEQALATGQQMGDESAIHTFGAQITAVRREQGRLAEVEPLIGGFIAQYSAIPAWRCALMYVRTELGRAEEAREDFERFTDALIAQAAGTPPPDPGAVLPRNDTWISAVATLCETGVQLGDRERCRQLFGLLAPYAERTVSVSVVCYGLVAHVLGRLADALGRWQDGERYYQQAIALGRRSGSPPFVARSQCNLAEMLHRRGERRDEARILELLGESLEVAGRIGMKPIVDAGLALKARVLGIDGDDVKSSLSVAASAVRQSATDLGDCVGADGIVTLAFGDIAGFADLVERIGDEQAHHLTRLHNRIVREQVATHGGREVEVQGDAVVLAFPDPAAALRCAIGIQRDLLSLSVDPGAVPVVARFGVHSGEAIRAGEGFFGKTVILTARIAAQAQAGEILVSAAARARLAAVENFSFLGTRVAALKGLAGEHEMHVVGWR